MDQLHKTASQISEAVQLSRHPVAIKFIDDLDAFRDKPTARGHRFCQLVMRARQGKTMVLTPEAISCPGAAAALGFKPLPPKLESGQMLKSLGIFSDPELGARTIRAIPQLELGRYQGIVAGPLGEVDFVPDVVIIEDQVEKLMWIALAWLNRQGDRLDFSTAILQAICVDCAVIPFSQHRLNMTFGCYGCRDATDIGPNEAALGFPADGLKDLAANLQILARKAIPNCRSKGLLNSLMKRNPMIGWIKHELGIGP
jgi:uncharacterized protein (DUF169 family)